MPNTQIALASLINAVLSDRISADEFLARCSDIAEKHRPSELLVWWDGVVVEPIRDHGYWADPYFSLSEFEDFLALSILLDNAPTEDELKTLMKIQDFAPSSDRASSISSVVQKLRPQYSELISKRRVKYLLFIVEDVLVDHRRLAVGNQALRQVVDLPAEYLTEVEMAFRDAFVGASRRGCSVPLMNFGKYDPVKAQLEAARSMAVAWLNG